MKYITFFLFQKQILYLVILSRVFKKKAIYYYHLNFILIFILAESWAVA